MEKKNKRGFTLIEILVVMGIIAVLAAIVLIAINPARQFAQARQTQRTSNVNAILNAIGQYIADNEGVLPADIGLAEEGIDDDEANICSDLVPDYLPALPVDPDNTATDPDEPIEAADCGAGDDYDSGYTVERDTNDRVRVCAPESTDEPALGTPAEICVTR